MGHAGDTHGDMVGFYTFFHGKIKCMHIRSVEMDSIECPSLVFRSYDAKLNNFFKKKLSWPCGVWLPIFGE